MDQPSDMDSSELRQRLRDAPEQTLAHEFGRYRARLYRIVKFRLDQRLAARLEPDDVLQEAWLAALKRVDHFLGRQTLPMFVWLRLMVGQTIVDLHRRHLGSRMRDAYREWTLDDRELSQSTAASMALQILGQFPTPSQAAVRDETARQLRESLEAMDPIDREVLALRHFEELSNSEVAETLAITPKAASIRYVRALQRLKRILDSLPGFHRDAGDHCE